MQNQRLQYERIIITGASSGFGKAFARTLASCTGELVLVARNKEALQQLAAELEEKHPGLRAAFPATWRTNPPWTIWPGAFWNCLRQKPS